MACASSEWLQQLSECFPFRRRFTCLYPSRKENQKTARSGVFMSSEMRDCHSGIQLLYLGLCGVRCLLARHGVGRGRRGRLVVTKSQGLITDWCLW